MTHLFRTTTKIKTTNLAHSRGQRCGDIDLAAYLQDAAGPVSLVMDLRLTHARSRVGSSSNPSLNAGLHYPAPADIDKQLNEAAADKILF
jgi:hypothetical protein